MSEEKKINIEDGNLARNEAVDEKEVKEETACNEAEEQEAATDEQTEEPAEEKTPLEKAEEK